MVAVAIRRDIAACDLRRQVRLERDGRVASRLLALAAVLDGVSREQAACIGGMDRQTLRDWVHRFNEAGVEGLRDRARPDRPCLLAEELLPELAALIADGPQIERDGVVEYRLSHIRELSRRHFGADYSQGGMHAVLRRMGFSWLKPRPIHPKTDLAAQEAFKKNFAQTLAGIQDQHPDAERVEVWFQDEARVGQKGSLTHLWAPTGTRPRAVRDHRFKSAYIFGAVCPARDTGVALVVSRASTEAMNLMLTEISQAVGDTAHAAVLIDGAGWHSANDLVVPANITLVPLPPYSPELNAIERLWQVMRDTLLSHRLFTDLNHIIEVCCTTWNALVNQPGRIRSTCGYAWAAPVKTS